MNIKFDFIINWFYNSLNEFLKEYFMSASVAEYLGQRTDIDSPIIKPIPLGTKIDCPFMESHCSKLKMAKNPKHPVCSIKDQNENLWITCPHRFCATIKSVPLSIYQKGMLHLIAKVVFFPEITQSQIAVRREEPIPVPGTRPYKADFVMMLNNPPEEYQGPNRFVLEMQGGGETSNTGSLSRHIDSWAENPERSNAILREIIPGVGTIQTNAWRRQQEQFIVKGNISQQTGGTIVFSMGSLIYDYIWNKIENENLKELRQFNWSLALLGIIEDTSVKSVAGPITLVIDKSRTLFTSYQSFVQALINQGEANPGMFEGEFELLSGETVKF